MIINLKVRELNCACTSMIIILFASDAFKELKIIEALTHNLTRPNLNHEMIANTVQCLLLFKNSDSDSVTNVIQCDDDLMKTLNYLHGQYLEDTSERPNSEIIRHSNYRSIGDLEFTSDDRNQNLAEEIKELLNFISHS